MSTVYVLGAGATKAAADDSPVTDDLLVKAFRRLESDQRIRRVRDFVGDFYLGLSADEMDGGFDDERLPRIEDVLSQLDISIQRREPLSARYPLSTLQEIRFDLNYLIYKILQTSLKQLDNPVYREFVGRIDDRDDVISLNYDIAVDNALLDRFEGASPFQGRLDYGIQAREEFLEPSYAEPYGETLGPIQLLKLHGSLNWLYCPDCQRVDVTERRKGVGYIFEGSSRAHCRHCDGRYEAALITPSFVRSFAGGLLDPIWNRAEVLVSKAKRLVFIGYSLPDADVHLRCMLKKALYANPHRESVPVLVIDGKLESRERPTAEEQRYTRWFGSQVTYEPIGFRNFKPRA